MMLSEIWKPVDDLRATVQSTRDCWFAWLIASTAAVGFGLALEGPELWFEIRDIFRRRRDRRRFFITWPAETPDWRKLLAFVGWIFIVLGVMAEGYTESKVSDADRVLQTFDESLIAETQKETMQLRINLEQEKQETARAQLALKAAFDAERERHEPRHVTPAQATCMSEALKGMSGQSLKLWIWKTPETQQYGSEIGAILNKALGPDSVSSPNFSPDSGILPTDIMYQGGSKQFVDAIGAALKCLVVNGAPKIIGGKEDSGQALEIFVFPDTSRRSR
jgi:hypothetical protein